MLACQGWCVCVGNSPVLTVRALGLQHVLVAAGPGLVCMGVGASRDAGDWAAAGVGR
jgi:hypothetical protein